MNATHPTWKSNPHGNPWPETRSRVTPTKICKPRKTTQAATAIVSLSLIVRSSSAVDSWIETREINAGDIRAAFSAFSSTDTVSGSSAITSCLICVAVAFVSILFSCWRRHSRCRMAVSTMCLTLICHLGMTTFAISRTAVFHLWASCTILAKLRAAIKCSAIIRDRRISISKQSFRDSREHLAPETQGEREGRFWLTVVRSQTENNNCKIESKTNLSVSRSVKLADKSLINNILLVPFYGSFR